MSLSDAGKVLKDHFRAGVCRMLIFESYPEIKEKVRLQIIFRLNSLYIINEERTGIFKLTSLKIPI